MRFLTPNAEGGSAHVQGATKDANGNNLADYALRIALCHSELHRRLKGEPEQLTKLPATSREALKTVLADKGLDTEKVDPFIAQGTAVIRDFFTRNATVSPEELPELNVARPLRPRFAPPDPLEPCRGKLAIPTAI